MKSARMAYIDNLRLTIIALVVCLHVAVTYGGLGSWYYKEIQPLGLDSLVFFAVFQSFLQAFFMGTLFLVAGYFAAASLKGRGRAGFVAGRLRRLGLPTLVYILGINPLTVYFLADAGRVRYPVPFTQFYSGYIRTLSFLGGTGPMWFALALLMFCVAYAVAWRPRPAEPARRSGPITVGLAVRVALLATVTAFAIRIVQPIGTSILNMQLCYFAQYVILFVLGIMAHGRGWFESLDYRLGRRLVLAAFLFIPLLPLLYVAGGALHGEREAMLGGMHWQSLAFSAWESFTGVFMSIGLPAVLKEKWNGQGLVTAALSGSAFAVYMFHPPVLVFISLLFRGLTVAPLPKFLLVAAVAVPASFAVGWLVRRVPVLRDLTPS